MFVHVEDAPKTNRVKPDVVTPNALDCQPAVEAVALLMFVDTDGWRENCRSNTTGVVNADDDRVDRFDSADTNR
jgi:hypothetical protein